jgi:multidrug transporter EmrE-like cation transporter
MAFGYAKSTGRVGTYTVVPGPGVLNSGAALCTAYGAITPVLCITGNIMSRLIGQGRGQLHELPDQLALLRGLTKWSERINHPTEAPRVMAEAFRQLASGRIRPVAVEAPWDVFGMKAEVTQVAPLGPIAAPTPDPDSIAAAAKLIAEAKRPLLSVGAGAQLAATAFLIAAMEQRSFVVAVAYSKTEIIQIALYSLVLLGERLSIPTAVAIVLASVGVVLLSVKPSAERQRAMASWFSPAATLGLASGAGFALSAVGYRGAALALDPALPWVAAIYSLVWAQAIQSVLLGGYLAVRDRAGLRKVMMQWRVSALAGGIGRLDDHVAAEIGDLAPELSFSQMVVGQRFLEPDAVPFDSRDRALFGDVVPAVAELRRRDDNCISDVPACDRLGKRYPPFAFGSRRAEFHPGATHRSPVEIHPTRAADDRGA